jgi:hypothetical protein
MPSLNNVFSYCFSFWIFHYSGSQEISKTDLERGEKRGKRTE